MPRANRIYLPGRIWHITHRCHDQVFLLGDESDRTNWRRWLREATLRHGLQVLNFVATSNHIHLLVYDDTGGGTIARGLQLVQGRAAQEYNRRNGRHGAFWQDRHHAVAVDTGSHLWACLVYIDLNMVRAGVVPHPKDWRAGGYHEIQQTRSHDRVLNLDRLADLADCSSIAQLQRDHLEQVASALSRGNIKRDARWTNAVAVGRECFVKGVQSRLGLSKRRRISTDEHGTYMLS